MERSLNSFETWVSLGMVRKGETYWKNGCVQNLAQDEETWAVDVYGTDKYVVEIKIKDGQVQTWVCDCPYDHGPICKHVVAVFFEVRAEIAKGNIAVVKQQSANKKQSNNPIEEIIGKLDESELRKLMSYFATRQEEVRSHLLSKYTHLIEVLSKKQFDDLVSSYIHAHSGGKYLEYREARKLGDAVTKLLDEAAYQDPMALVYLCEAVIEQVAEAYQSADDSSCSLGGAIATAFSMLYGLVDEDNEESEELVQHIFDYACQECNKKRYQNGNWEGDFESVACEAIRDKAQAAKLMAIIDQSIARDKQEKYRSYHIEQSARLQLDLLKEYYSEAEATIFLENNLHYSSFRKMALAQAFEEKKFEAVRRLAEEGIVLDTANKLRGLVNEWKQWLIRVADKTGDTTALIKMQEQLFLEDGNMEAYRKLKKLIPKATFDKKIENYIDYFRKEAKSKWGPSFNQRIANILEEEERWEDLMQELKIKPSFYLMDQYFKLLGQRYPAIFIQYYAQLVRQKMERSGGRSLYQECCRYLDKIIGLGGVEEVKVIVKEWREKYSNRRAMLEELRRFKW